MPSCIIKGCQHTWKQKNANVIMHAFPKEKTAIRLWLSQAPEHFHNLEELADRIHANKANDVYRMCSKHFADDQYFHENTKRRLRPNAVPSIFPIKKSPELDDDAFNKRPLKRKRSSKSYSEKGMVDIGINTDVFLHKICRAVGTDPSYGKKDASTQTMPQKGISKACMCDLQKSDALLLEMKKVTTSFSNLPPISEDTDSWSSIDESREEVDDTLYLEDSDLEDEDSQESSSDDDDLMEEGKFEEIIYDSPDLANEPKFIIFKSSLHKLLSLIPCQFTKSCHSSLTHVHFKKIGSMLIIDARCTSGHVSTLWHSQPSSNRFPIGNVALASAVILSGSSFLKVSNFFNILNISMISHSTYYRYQRRFLFPTIHHHWLTEKSKVIESLRNTPICLVGDGQADSPGFCAKYCTYTLIEAKSNKIVGFNVQQIIPPITSVCLEKIAFQKTLEDLLSENVNVRIVATDRHMGIRKLIREEYSHILHQFDIWHVAKSVGQKILCASKLKNCHELANWVAPVKNHLWWCAKHCNKDPNMLVAQWQSAKYHVVNVHEWPNNALYPKCHHDQLPEDTKWLKINSLPHERLKSVIDNPTLLRDIRHLTFFCHTGNLEIFHSTTLKYRPKRIHYNHDSMVARTELSALDHNYNVGRRQATARGFDGEEKEKYRVEYSKARRSWVVKKLYEPKSNEFLKPILNDVLGAVAGEKLFHWESARGILPVNIAPVEKPCKEELIQKFKSRF
ncbi:uncharacterized protein [Engystomops pustulosus]|uniref:uncharacterized protein n=1 Tax=Engystomops pustulosus TaxID=76066 RepID=UPI003AFA0BC9